MLRNDQLDQWDRDHFFHPSTHLGQFARGEAPNRTKRFTFSGALGRSGCVASSTRIA